MINLTSYDISYVPVPKNACTTIKLALYKLDNGQSFVPKNGFHIHNFSKLYFTKAYEDWYPHHVSKNFCFAVVRDPLDRIVSCFLNRVVYFQALRGTKFEFVGDSFDDFVKNIDEICLVSKDIDHHTKSQRYFLGLDLTLYDRIYKIHELGMLRSDLEEQTKKQISFGVHNLSKKDNSFEVSSSTRKIIRQRYEIDYDVYF